MSFITRILPLVAAGLAAALLVGCERPPVTAIQNGYRGTGMEQVNNPRIDAVTVRNNQAPVSTPAVGDLVFFGAPAYHVGIYAGNGMMWDSPHTGMSVALRSVFSSSASYGRV